MPNVITPNLIKRLRIKHAEFLMHAIEAFCMKDNGEVVVFSTATSDIGFIRDVSGYLRVDQMVLKGR